MTQAQAHNRAPDQISDSDFESIATLVFELTGISLKINKKNMVAARMAKLLRATGQRSISEYIGHLKCPNNSAELDRFVSAYTTNMTRFNREDRHFTHLADRVLPQIAARARAGDRIRLWSAACSSGEEPYQIAFHLLDCCPEASKLNIKILATDVDREILKVAQTGVYPRTSVSTLPGHQIERYFEPFSASSDRLSVKQNIRDLVVFRRLNLNDNWPFKGKFDLIMCRNVAIYFDDFVQARMWGRFASQMTTNGILYIGHSEGLDAQNAQKFEQIDGNAAYRLRAQDAPRPAAMAPK